MIKFNLMLANVFVVTVICSNSVLGDISSVGIYSDPNNNGFGIVAEYHSEKLRINSDGADIRWTTSVLLDNNDNGFVGTGISAEYRLSDTNFIEASFMPGYYKEGDVDLGGHMHFRSTLGIGTNITDSAALSFAFSHIANSGLNNRNPGMDVVMPRLSDRH